jgi:hypothetical protein
MTSEILIQKLINVLTDIDKVKKFTIINHNIITKYANINNISGTLNKFNHNPNEFGEIKKINYFYKKISQFILETKSKLDNEECKDFMNILNELKEKIKKYMIDAIRYSKKNNLQEFIDSQSKNITLSFLFKDTEDGTNTDGLIDMKNKSIIQAPKTSDNMYDSKDEIDTSKLSTKATDDVYNIEDNKIQNLDNVCLMNTKVHQNEEKINVTITELTKNSMDIECANPNVNPKLKSLEGTILRIDNTYKNALNRNELKLDSIMGKLNEITLEPLQNSTKRIEDAERINNGRQDAKLNVILSKLEPLEIANQKLDFVLNKLDKPKAQPLEISLKKLELLVDKTKVIEETSQKLDNVMGKIENNQDDIVEKIMKKMDSHKNNFLSECVEKLEFVQNTFIDSLTSKLSKNNTIVVKKSLGDLENSQKEFLQSSIIKLETLQKNFLNNQSSKVTNESVELLDLLQKILLEATIKKVEESQKIFLESLLPNITSSSGRNAGKNLDKSIEIINESQDEFMKNIVKKIDNIQKYQLEKHFDKIEEVLKVNRSKITDIENVYNNKFNIKMDESQKTLCELIEQRFDTLQNKLIHDGSQKKDNARIQLLTASVARLEKTIEKLYISHKHQDSKILDKIGTINVENKTKMESPIQKIRELYDAQKNIESSFESIKKPQEELKNTLVQFQEAQDQKNKQFEETQKTLINKLELLVELSKDIPKKNTNTNKNKINIISDNLSNKINIMTEDLSDEILPQINPNGNTKNKYNQINYQNNVSHINQRNSNKNKTRRSFNDENDIESFNAIKDKLKNIDKIVNILVMILNTLCENIKEQLDKINTNGFDYYVKTADIDYYNKLLNVFISQFASFAFKHHTAVSDDKDAQFQEYSVIYNGDSIKICIIDCIGISKTVNSGKKYIKIKINNVIAEIECLSIDERLTYKNLSKALTRTMYNINQVIYVLNRNKDIIANGIDLIKNLEE